MSDESDLARRSQQATELAQHEAVGRGGARVIVNLRPGVEGADPGALVRAIREGWREALDTVPRRDLV